MGAVGLLGRLEVRRRRLRIVFVIVLVGAIGGLALAAAAGARRSSSSLDRFRVASRAADVEIGGIGEPTAAQLHDLERRGGVRAVAGLRAYAVVFNREQVLEAVGAPIDRAFGTRVDRGRVVAGREVDPAAPNEVAVGEALARQLHLGVGDTLRAKSYSVDQVERILAGTSDVGAFAGPRVRLRVVGIVRRPLDLSNRAASGGFLVLSPAFGHKYADRIGRFGTYLRVRTANGAEGVPKAISAARKVFGHSLLLSQGLTVESEGARDAIRVLTLALWIVAMVVAIGGVVAAGIVLDREIALFSVDDSTLRALGLTRRQRVAVSGPLALLVAGGSVLVAVLVAIGLSPLFPTGVARRADPDPGIHADWAILALGAALVVMAVLGVALVSAFRATGRSDAKVGARSRRRAPAAVGVAARAGLPATMTNGLRMAIDRGGEGRTRAVRSAFVGAVLGVVGITAVLVFVPSLDHLAGTPRLYGWTWDVAMRDVTANTPCGGDEFGISQVRGLAAIGEVCNQSVQFDGRPVSALAFTSIRGDAAGGGVVAGRAPRGPGEVALGTKTLDALGKDVGDTVRAKGRSTTLNFEVVGRVVLPTLGQDQTLADGAVFTGAGFAPLFDQNIFQRYFVVRFAAGADRASVARRLAAIPQLAPPARPMQPIEVARLRQVDWFPVVLAILLGVLGLVAVEHTLITSAQRRRGEFAVLKSLGFKRRQVRATVGWQATTVAAVGLLIGIPVGLVIGKVVWRAIAHGLGTASITATPVAAVLVTIPAALLVVNLAALVPAYVAARRPPAVALRSE